MVNNLLAMNKNAGGTNVPTKGTIQGFSGGGMIEVQGTGNTVEGTLKMKDISGKQVGKTYSAISGTYAGMNIVQKDRGYTRNAPMPDGTYKLVGYQNMVLIQVFLESDIGVHMLLMVVDLLVVVVVSCFHNDIGSNGTLGCIGVELGGVAGTKAEQEFLKTYDQVKPETIKVALGGSSGDASEVSPVSSTRAVYPDNAVKASISSQPTARPPGPSQPVVNQV